MSCLRIAAVTLAALLAVTAVQATALAADPTPEWIWTSDKPKDNERAFFRKTIELKAKPKSAAFIGSCDNGMTLFVNGQQLAEGNEWASPTKQDLTKRLKEGKNVIAIRGRNNEGIAALVGKITIEHADGKKEVIVTDGSWLASAEDTSGWQKADFDASKWGKPHSFGKYGRQPWGEVFAGGGSGSSSSATDPSAIQTLPGFEVELLYSVPKDQQGSWVSMTTDPKGRLIVSDQYGPMYRVTPGKDAATTKVEKLDIPIGEAQGLLYAYDGLYIVVNGNAAQGSGLYKATDTNGDDQFDDVKLLKKFHGGGEHGPHAVRLGPDGKLWVIAGNHTKPPEGLSANSPHRNWAEDLLLPRNPDGNGHATGVMAPGGWVCRTDKDGKEWEIFCAGFRNQYDIAFNDDGELFSYDADMEWDTGTPWYRPTRVNHAVSAAEFGWRFGTGKWPDYYADSLGAVVDIGLGSPTGIEFGTGAKFPEKYQKALYILDWTYGKIYAVHMTPSGASYAGEFETFVQGRPLPVTDAVVGKDGALYFTIGGRRTQSGLYRVTFKGNPAEVPAASADDAKAAAERALASKSNAEKAAEARKQRQKLESFHGKQDPAAVEAAWQFLNSSDRHLRYAARVAIEHQDLASWQNKALAENRTTAAIECVIALARTADKSLQPKLVEKLNSLPFQRMNEEQLLAAARAYGLVFIRMGDPDDAMAKSVIDKLSPLFPSGSEYVSREMCSLLVYLQWPGVVEPAMKKMQSAQTQQDQMYYVFVLRNVAQLLNAEQRQAYFSWLNLAEKNYRGGSSFQKFIQQIRRDASGKLSEADRVALKDVIEGKQNVEAVKLETTRQFIHNWQMEDLVSMLGEVESGRSFDKGRSAYEAAQCAKCHRFAGQGGDTGPDITGVGNRFNPHYILEAMIHPSKAISDQYLSSVLLTTDGEVIRGRVIEETPDSVKIRIDPFALELTEVKKADIEERQLAKISEMPQGLINTLTKEEILDLIAYLRSAGNPDDKAFKK
jgi:putative heme-binding domain-containing protein